MTREEQIRAAAKKITGLFSYRNGYSTAEDAFAAGATWADANPCMPDKVVKIPVYTEEEIHEMLEKDLYRAYYNDLFLGRKIYTSPWISVEDGLPSVNNNGESKMVFVRVINKHSKEEWIELRAKYNINIKDWIAMDFTHIGKRNGIVTHWMPIPQLPKEEKK